MSALIIYILRRSSRFYLPAVRIHGRVTRHSDIGLEFLRRRCRWPEVALGETWVDLPERRLGPVCRTAGAMGCSREEQLNAARIPTSELAMTRNLNSACGV